MACVYFVVAGAILLSQASAANPSTDPPPRVLKPGEPKPYKGDLVSLAALNIRNVQLETVLSELKELWAIEFLGPDELIISEIRGRLYRYKISTKVLQPISGLPRIATESEQTGLLDIELHPDFKHNKRIYFSYSASDEETGRFFLTAVATAELRGTDLLGVHDILRAGPFSWSPSNFGGALEFDPEGYLYVAVGDRSEHMFAQQGERLQGKILRLNDDGSVPADNPFVNDATVDDRIYALGVRNAQGLHYDITYGQLFEAEHGPLGGDEINIIQAGANYGWPTITYGQNYTTEAIGIGPHQSGLLQPLWYYLPSIAASPLTVYRGPMFPEWDGHLLVGALAGKHISKLDLDGNRIRSERALLGELKDRIRDIKVAADGSIFVLTQNKGLQRLFRVPPPPATEKPDNSELLYQMICSGCHDTGTSGAPRLTEPTQWTNIMAKPREDVYRNTIDGYREMPERGLCYICTNGQLKATVEYMLDRVRVK